VQKWFRRPAEVRLSWVVPALLIVGLLLNYNIAQAGPLQLEAFAPVVVHASLRADYSKDALDLSFPPVDPGLAEEILKEIGSQDEADDSAAPTEGVTATSTALASGQATPTPLLGGLPTLPVLPTLPPLLPTQLPLLPTVPALLPTAVPAIVTQASEIIDDAEDLVEDTVDAVKTVVPLPTGCVLGILC
jgi:hypothetical protein